MIRSFCLGLLLFTSFDLLAFDIKTFREGVSNKSAIYNDFTSRPETDALFTEGRVSESNKRLKALIPGDKKTVYDFFILANMLFQNDREASYKFMVEAENKEPENPFVLFERGIHEHRLGNYSLAQTYYERFQESGLSNGNVMLSAYLTHVYLMTGQAEKALISWKEANFGRNHTSIEKAMYTIFSKNNQEHNRESLVSEIKSGATLKLCDLYQLDSNWEVDWWNYKPKKTYLKYDIKLAALTLKSGTIDDKYFQLCSDTESVSDQMYISRLREIGFFSESEILPESSSLIYEILKRLISTKSMTPEEFLKRFENQIVSLSKKYPNDRKYFDVLAYLYANTGNQEKLKSIDRYGWKNLKIENYALSSIAGIDPKSELYISALNEALEDFPLSATLSQYRLIVETEHKEDAFIKFAASQFANVKNNWSGPYRLNDYMASLKYELDKLEKRL